jgi:hypothetical protein
MNPDLEGGTMDDRQERRPGFLARFAGDQIAVAVVVAALILLVLLIPSALLR